MDGGHPDENPIPNQHEITLDWFRTRLDVAHNIFPDLDVELQIPFDVKRQKVRFKTLDGQEFDNPLGELHHRNETRKGLGDIRLYLNYRTSDLFLENDTLHLGIGISTPTGRIEEDPFELGDLGLRHQHIQFGTGTVDPLFRVGYSIRPDGWNLNLSLGAHIPFYENRKSFKAPIFFDFSVGPKITITDWLGFGAHYVMTYQTRGYWDGEPDQNTGFTLQGLSVTAPIRISSVVTAIPRAFFPFSVDTRGKADTFDLDVLLGLSFEITLGK